MRSFTFVRLQDVPGEIKQRKVFWKFNYKNMAWNPEKYDQFKNERYLPAFDLMGHIQVKPGMKVIDLGCGTGELTKFLAEKLDGSTVTGIDNSKEMLAKAMPASNLSFELSTIENELGKPGKWDVIFANAALQWVEHHETLFPQIISKLNKGGQLAVQMPSQTENVLNKLLLEVVGEDYFAAVLNNWKRESPVLSMDEYAQLLFEHDATSMTIYQKVYPIIANDHGNLFDFISGSSLLPYMERFPGDVKEEFVKVFRERIKLHFPKMPAIYAFKRMLIYATF